MRFFFVYYFSENAFLNFFVNFSNHFNVCCREVVGGAGGRAGEGAKWVVGKGLVEVKYFLVCHHFTTTLQEKNGVKKRNSKGRGQRLV